MRHDRSIHRAVPCGLCTACCKSDLIFLQPGEAHRFRWHYEGGRQVLDRKSNGECIYLTPTGCSVHDDPPDICRRFDCRVLYLETPKSMRKRRIVENPTMKFVYAAGKTRLATLEAA